MSRVPPELVTAWSKVRSGAVMVPGPLSWPSGETKSGPVRWPSRPSQLESTRPVSGLSAAPGWIEATVGRQSVAAYPSLSTSRRVRAGEAASDGLLALHVLDRALGARDVADGRVRGDVLGRVLAYDERQAARLPGGTDRGDHVAGDHQRVLLVRVAGVRDRLGPGEHDVVDLVVAVGVDHLRAGDARRRVGGCPGSGCNGNDQQARNGDREHAKGQLQGGLLRVARSPVCDTK